MKLRLPGVLLAAVLSGFSLVSTTISAGESIHINFKGNQGNLGSGNHGATEVAAPADNWYNAANKSGNVSGAANLHGATLSYNASAIWSRASSSLTNLDGLTNGYLDDGGTGVSIAVSGLDFLIYETYIYFTSDTTPTSDGHFRAVNVNGDSYTAALVDENGEQVLRTTQGDTNWGSVGELVSGKTYVEGQQYLKVGGLSGTLQIQGAAVAANDRANGRACISGIQIVDATDQYTWSRTIDGETTWNAQSWSNGTETVTTKSWADILADTSLRPIAELAGTGTVNLEGGVTAEAVIAQSGSSITLSGGTLTLNGLATLLVQSGATLTLDAAVETAGSVTVTGSGSLILNTDQAWHGLAGGGSIEVASGKTLTVDGTASSSFTGRITLNDASRMEVAAHDFSNTFSSEGTGTLSLAIDGQGASFGSSSIWGVSSGAAGSREAVVSNATISNLNILSGASTYGSVETTISQTTVTGTLSLGTGVLTAANGFVINVGEGSVISNVRLMGSGSAVTGDVTLNVTGGTLGAGGAGIEGGMFSFVGQDSKLTGNVYFNISGGSIVAANLAFGGFGQKDNQSLVGNVSMTLSGGSVESNIYAGSSWGGRIAGNMTITLQGGSVGVAGQNRSLNAGCTGNNSWAAQSVSGDVNYLLNGGDDGYGTSFLGNYAIYGGGERGTVGGKSTISLSNVLYRDETDATRGVANFTGVISGGNANGGGVTGAKALVFDNYQTLAQANFKFFDTATVQNGSHVTLNNAANSNIAAWTVKDTSELTVTVGALGGGTVALESGARLIYNSGDSTTAETLSGLTGSGTLVKKGSNTLTVNSDAAAHTVSLEGGSLALNHQLTANRVSIASGTSLVLQAGASLAATALTNDGSIMIEGAASLDASSAALTGNVEWTGGSLTLGSTDQYAATTTTLTSNASYMILTLTGAADADTTIRFALGDLHLDGGLLTFSMTGDTSAFSIDHFSMTTTSITGTGTVSDSIFLNLNNTIYQGSAEADGTITFSSVSDLPTNGSSDPAANYKLNGSTVLAAQTAVNNLFLLPSDEAAGLTLAMEESGSLIINGKLTVEGGAGAVNLAGGHATAEDVKLTSGNLVLQQGATLTVNHDLASTGGSIQFDGGTFAYGSGFSGDISSLITGSGTIRVATSGNNVAWETAVAAPLVKSGEGRLTIMAGALNAGGNFTVDGGELAIAVNSNVTTSITADHKLVLSGNKTLVKTGAGTWEISQSANATQANSDAMSASSFTGDILIEQGTLRLGKTTTSGIYNNYTVSANALGSTGTIRVGKGATFELGITQNATVTFAKSVDLAANATMRTYDGNFTFTGKLSLSGDATIQADWGKTVTIRNLIEGTGKLTVKHGGGSERGILKLDAQNAAGFAGTVFTGGLDVTDGNMDVQFTHTQALGTGNISLANTTNKLDYVGSGSSYESMANVVSGAGGLKVSSGYLELSGANTYTGATTVASGSLKVTGSVGAATAANTYSVANGASLVVSGAGAIANSAVRISARPAMTRDVADGTLTNVTVNTTGIARTSGTGQGTIEKGRIIVTREDGFTVDHINLVNTLVELQSAGSITLDNVTIGGGTVIDNGTGSVALNNSQLVMTTANTTVGSLDTATHTLSVSSTGLAGITSINGSLTLELSKEWIDALVAVASGNFTSIELTFTDADATAWEAFRTASGSSLSTTGALNHDMFGVGVTFGDTAGKVIIATAPPVNIPEPAATGLALLGLGALLLRRRRLH